jgi:hypothetical protein
MPINPIWRNVNTDKMNTVGHIRTHFRIVSVGYMLTYTVVMNLCMDWRLTHDTQIRIYPSFRIWRLKLLSFGTSWHIVCYLVDTFQSFGGTCCLNLSPEIQRPTKHSTSVSVPRNAFSILMNHSLNQATLNSDSLPSTGNIKHNVNKSN